MGACFFWNPVWGVFLSRQWEVPRQGWISAFFQRNGYCRMQVTEAITSLRRAEEQYRLSNPNDFLEKWITIAPVSPDSASLVHACIWFDLSTVQSPLSHHSGNLPSYQFFCSRHTGVEGGNRLSRSPKCSHFSVTLDCNNQLCNANYPQLSYKRHPAWQGDASPSKCGNLIPNAKGIRL